MNRCIAIPEAPRLQDSKTASLNAESDRTPQIWAVSTQPGPIPDFFSAARALAIAQGLRMVFIEPAIRAKSRRQQPLARQAQASERIAAATEELASGVAEAAA